MFPRDERFYGERLQLAREFRGLTQKQLAADVVASHSLISQYETGRMTDPPEDLVNAVAEVLGFAPDFFYRPLEDPFTEQQCNFRHKRTAPEKLKTQVRAHATLIGMVIAELRKRLKFPNENVPVFHANSTDEIERAAESTRKHWGLGIDAPLLHVGRILENAGVIIVPHFVQSTKIDAFSRFGHTTVIFLNQAIESTSRWIFDIGHECGHLVMHRDTNTGSEETERAADRFASAFLMPRQAFARDFRAAPFSWKHVFDLKRHWLSSAAAIVRRGYDLGLLSAVEYRRAYQYISVKGWRTNGEPFEPTFKDPELLGSAFTALKSKTLADLCRDLAFTERTFCDVTGTEIPKESRPLRPILLSR